MKKAWEIVVKELENISKKITTPEEIAQVASLSAQDNEVWEIIANAMHKVWNDWVISVEDGVAFGLELEVTKWMQFDSWYASPYMVSNTEKMLAEIKDAHILITDQKISNMKDLVPLLEQLLQAWKKDLVIIAEDIEAEALTTIILNKLKWILNVLAIKAPWFGDRKKEILKDIAILTNANLITQDLAMKFENVTMQDLWNAKSVIASKDKTTIIDWAWDKDAINTRALEIRELIKKTDSSYDREKLAERLAKLAWWVAVIKVGAASEVEAKEKKLRIEDALNATRAAVEEWIVAWGWVALLKASKVLENIDFWNIDQNIWASIVKDALSYPVKQIVSNAWKEWSVVVNKILENSSDNFWYDAANDEYVDMIKAWIIDPKKVERIALIESISLAWMFLTTECWIVDIPKKEEPTHDMWGMWMPWMY